MQGRKATGPRFLRDAYHDATKDPKIAGLPLAALIPIWRRRIMQTPTYSICSPERTVLLIRVLAVWLLCWSTLAQTEEPPFEWDPSFSSPGTSLSVDVLQTISPPPNGSVVLSIKSTGFAEAGPTLALWKKIGGEYYKFEPPNFEPTLSAEGVVLLRPDANDTMGLVDHIRGQPFDIALVDEATNRRAQVKITPFPITAIGSGECKASAEVQSASALLWVITLSGFESGEDVTITSTFKAGVFKKEKLTDNVVTSETGEISFPILFPKRSKGNAAVMAQGSAGCSVTLDYAIGKSALKAK